MDLAHVVALLAPPACVSCRAPVSAGERLCPPCTRALPWLRRACPRCALPSHRGRACPASGAAFMRAWAPMAYEGVARDLVAALKFRAALGVANVMAAHMAANLPPELRGPAVAAGVVSAGGGAGAGGGAAPPVSAGGGAGACGGAAPPVSAGGGAGAGGGAAPPVIVPVPTVAGRRRRRGFDPAGVLAAALARRLDSPLA